MRILVALTKLTLAPNDGYSYDIDRLAHDYALAVQAAIERVYPHSTVEVNISRMNTYNHVAVDDVNADNVYEIEDFVEQTILTEVYNQLDMRKYTF